MEFLFLLIGLAFFIWVMRDVRESEQESYQRRLNEQREFGYRLDPQQEPPTHRRHH